MKNFFLLVSKILNTLINPIISLYLVRFASKDIYGQYSKVFFWVMLINSLKEFGFSQSIVKDLSQNSQHTKNIISRYIQLSNALLVTSVLFLLLLTITDVISFRFTVLLTPLLMTGSLMSFVFPYFQCKRNIRAMMLFQWIQTFVAIISLTISFNSENIFKTFLLINFIILFLFYFFFSLWFYKTESISKKHIIILNFSKIFEIKDLGLSQIFYSFYQRFPVVLSSSLLNSVNVATYSLGVRFFNLSSEPAGVFFNNIINRHYFSSNGNVSNKISSISILFTSLTPICAILFTYLLGEHFIHIVFSGKYDSLWKYFPWLILFTFSRYLSGYLVVVLNSIKYEKAVKRIRGFSLIFVISSTFILVKKLNLTGAFLSLGLSEFIYVTLLSITYLKVNKVVDKRVIIAFFINNGIGLFSVYKVLL